MTVVCPFCQVPLVRQEARRMDLICPECRLYRMAGSYLQQWIRERTDDTIRVLKDVKGLTPTTYVTQLDAIFVDQLEDRPSTARRIIFHEDRTASPSGSGPGEDS